MIGRSEKQTPSLQPTRRLTSNENLLISGSGGVTLAYDPLMRLYQVAGAATTRFAYDGADVIAEYDGASQLQRRLMTLPRSSCDR